MSSLGAILLILSVYWCSKFGKICFTLEHSMRPERVHNFLFQAQHAASARQYWQTELWAKLPNPSHHDPAAIRRRARYNSLNAPGAASFLTAHPSATTTVHSTQWSLMLRRHLGIRVYDDSLSPLRCSHCSATMDALGDHASMCANGYGTVHRHNIVRNLFARFVFRPAGLSCDLEVPSLIPRTTHRPADILVQPAPPLPGLPPDKPTAYDVTVRSPYASGTIRKAAQKLAGGAQLAHNSKLSSHRRTVCDALHLPNDADIPPLDWHFVPLAFDTLGAPSARSAAVIEAHARLIASRSAATYATAKLRIQQRLSFAIWSSIAAATFARTHSVDADTSYPIPV